MRPKILSEESMRENARKIISREGLNPKVLAGWRAFPGCHIVCSPEKAKELKEHGLIDYIKR